jgi:hypothetical protein|tara:strand:- start:90 stop:296 length:207 start_codon:yes stop_codon:yes gene_type:complete
MPNRCAYCQIKKPTNHLWLKDSDKGGHFTWIEFCTPCGNKETLIGTLDGEVKTVKEVFDTLTAERIGS